MATSFDVRDPETGDLHAVTHYSLTETARRFHTSRAFIKRGADDGRFPCLIVNGRYWFSDDHLGAVYAALESGGPTRPPARLAVAVADPDTALRGVR